MTARAQKFKLQLRRHRLVITIRRFRVSSSNRSRLQRQFLVSTHIASIRQVAIQYQHVKPVGRPKHVAGNQYWRLRATFPLGLVILGVVGLLFFGNQFMANKSLQPAKAFASAPIVKVPKPKTLAASVPTHISIPSVGIDADIISVGLDNKGSIALPPLFSWQAGWYSGSPTPGELGPSIIVGHVDTYKGISVFWRLREVQPGDQVIINRADGTTANFKISALQQYDQHNFPTETVYKNLDYAGLQLITCGGSFDEQTQHYTENTVVSAKLE